MQGQRRAAWEAVHGAADTTVAGSVRDDREGDAAASPSGSDAEASDADGVYLLPFSASPISTLKIWLYCVGSDHENRITNSSAKCLSILYGQR